MTDDRILELWSGEKNTRPVLGANKVLTFARAILAEAVPVGWKLVPVEPTPEMLIRGGEEFFDSARNRQIGSTLNDKDHAMMIYEGMLSAAPSPDVQPVAQEPVAWRTFDGEGGYDYRSFDDNENYRECYILRNGQKYAGWVEPLYLHPQPDLTAEVGRLREILSAQVSQAESQQTVYRNRIAELEQIIEDQRTLYRNATAIANELDQVKRQRDRLVEALEEAREQVVSWAAYASEYFQQKHDLAGYVAKLDAALASVRGDNAEMRGASRLYGEASLSIDGLAAEEK